MVNIDKKYLKIMTDLSGSVGCGHLVSINDTDELLEFNRLVGLGLMSVSVPYCEPNKLFYSITGEGLVKTFVQTTPECDGSKNYIVYKHINETYEIETTKNKLEEALVYAKEESFLSTFAYSVCDEHDVILYMVKNGEYVKRPPWIR